MHLRWPSSVVGGPGISSAHVFKFGAETAYLGWGVLVAFDLVQRFFCGVRNILWWVVAAAHGQILIPGNGQPGLPTHKKPCPMLMIGCTGDAVAASFTMVLELP